MKSTAASVLTTALAVFAFIGVARGGVVQANLSALTRSGSALVGIEFTTGDIKRSTDGGATSSTVRSATATPLRNLDAYGSTVIAVGDSGAISRSADGGASWTDLSTTAAPAVGPLRDVASGNGTFWVAVGQNNAGNITSEWSNDGGLNWSAATTLPAVSGQLNGVAYDSTTGRWAAVGTDFLMQAVLLTSTDGKSWTVVTAPSGAAGLNDIATDGNGNLLAVGDAGTLLTSANGGTSYSLEANSGAVSENLFAVVYSSTSGFYLGGQNLVQMTYTVAGGTVLVQPPVTNGGDVSALAVDGSGTVMVSGSGFANVAVVTLGNLSATYDGTAKSATATTSPGSLTVNFTYNGSGVAPTNAGSYTVVGTVADAVYKGAATGTLVIAKANQTINFGALSDTTLAASPLTLAATASSGLTVSYTVVSGPANVSGGNTLNLTGSGTVTVRASQTGSGNYNAASPVDQSFNISNTVATVALSNTTVTYDGTAKNVTTTTNPVGLTVNVTYDGSPTAPTNAGTYAVAATISDATYSGSTSGTFTIGKADQTIDFAGPGDQPFSTLPIPLAATATSGLSVEFSLVSGPAQVSGNSLTLLGAGTVVVQASQPGNSNYNDAAPVSHSFVVGGSFETWQLDNFSETELLNSNISGPNAVYGVDGLTNLLRYALGLPAKTVVTSGLPQIAVTANDWTFTYTRPASITDAVYEVETSTDLQSWGTAATHEKLSTSNDVDTWQARVALNSETKVFFRLKVSRGVAR